MADRRLARSPEPKRFKVKIEMVFDDTGEPAASVELVKELFEQCFNLAFDDNGEVRHVKELTKIEVEEVPR